MAQMSSSLILFKTASVSKRWGHYCDSGYLSLMVAWVHRLMLRLRFYSLKKWGLDTRQVFLLLETLTLPSKFFENKVIKKMPKTIPFLKLIFSDEKRNQEKFSNWKLIRRYWMLFTSPQNIHNLYSEQKSWISRPWQ